MNLLDKFDVIPTKEILSYHDKFRCNEIYQEYKKTFDFYKNMYFIYIGQAKIYTKNEDIAANNYLMESAKKILSLIDSLGYWLKEKIYKYFINQYDIKIDYVLDKTNEYCSWQIMPKIDDIVPSKIQGYLDDIVLKQEGLSFDEMQKTQLLKKLRSVCYNPYQKNWKMEVKGEKIVFSDLIYWSKDYWDEYECSRESRGNFGIVAKAVAMFEQNTSNASFDVLELTGYTTKWKEIDHSFEINGKKVKCAKIFKNGRADFVFSSPELCREFAVKWCNFNLAAA